MSTEPGTASKTQPPAPPAATPIHLIARLLLAGGFVFSGINKLFDFGGAVQEMARNGLPFPGIVAAAVITTQLGGSILLLFSRTSWIGAGLLAGFTAMATLIAHAPWNASSPIPLPQSVIFLQNAGILGGLLLALAIGGGHRHVRSLFDHLRSR